MKHDRFVLQCLFAIAWSDGELVEEERELLRSLGSAMNLSDDLASEVEGWYANAPDPEVGAPLSFSSQEAERLMRWIFEIASADMIFSLKEYQFVTRLREHIGMTEDMYHRLQREVEEQIKEESALRREKP